MGRMVRRAGLLSLLLVARGVEAAPLCGETTCQAVTAAYISHFTGPGCTGIESYYTPYFSGDGIPRSWDGHGVAGTTLRTVTNKSYKDDTGACSDAWPSGNTLTDFITIYRCGAGTKLCGSECIPSTGCCGDPDCGPAPMCQTGVGTCTNYVCQYTPQADGVGCELDGDLCTIDACQAGACTSLGPKSCAPSNSCTAATCAAASGACVETALPAGAPCNGSNSCVQNGTCDAAGTCSGTIVADGTPCALAGCSAASSCSGGACICATGGGPSGPSDGSGPAPIAQPEKSGCSFAPSSDGPAAFLVGVLGLWLSRRRRLRA
jgi:MYXO-CTERM domain-containing protein